VLKKPAILKRLTEMGCLLQMNAEALEVKGVKSFALAALKKGLISALGTDMHNMSDRPPNMKIYSIALQLHGLPIELAQKILDTEYAILSDRPVQTTEGKLRRIFGKYF
jgi:protein-tyrosine phosphatase